MLLQGFQLMTQSWSLRGEESVLLSHLADALQELAHTGTDATLLTQKHSSTHTRVGAGAGPEPVKAGLQLN